MVEINEHLYIPDDELHWQFARSSGPGGQNVNKVASKAILRWNVTRSTCLPQDVKERLCAQQRQRITTEGDLLLSSQRYRDQERNKQDCLEKLRQWIMQAVVPPKPRKPTRPTRGSRQARLQAKQRRSAVKTSRRRPPAE